MKYYRQIYFYTFILGFCFLPAISPQAGTLTGIMQMQDGTPMAGGVAIIFTGDAGPPPLLTEGTREPEFVAELNSDGVFKIKLQEGTYYIGAVQWQDGNGPGKPVKGDNFFIMRTTPIQVPAEGLIDLGVLPRGETIR